MADLSPDVMKQLYSETDARFWAQTGYGVGRKLDPTKPADKAMMKTWDDIFNKVSAQYKAGTLAFTYNSPVVQQHLSAAQAATGDVIAHLDAASKTTDPSTKQQHIAAAGAAQQSAQKSAAAAAAKQPPTVSPKVTAASLQQALAATGLGAVAHGVADMLRPVIAPFMPDHPVNGAAAQPSSPELAVAEQQTQPPEPPQTAEDYLALQQAHNAVGNAAAAHTSADAKEEGFFAKHGELIAVAGAIAVGGAIAIFTSGKNHRGSRRSSPRTVRVTGKLVRT